jgi:Tfp pilus assembly protein PilO
MIKALLLQMLRENRFLLATALCCCLACITVWSSVLLKARHLERQQEVWHTARKQVHARGLPQNRELERVSVLLASLPATHELPRLIEKLHGLAKQSGVTLESLHYKPAPPVMSGVSAYSLQLSADGRYPALKRLLATLERLEGITVLESAKLSRTDPAVAETTLDAHLTCYLREARR